MEFKKLSKYNINITHTVNGGCIVKIGCGRAVFTDHNAMLIALKEYYDDPEGMEKKYYDIQKNDCCEEAAPGGPTGRVLRRDPRAVSEEANCVEESGPEDQCESEG